MLLFLMIDLCKTRRIVDKKREVFRGFKLKQKRNTDEDERDKIRKLLIEFMLKF